MKPITTDAYSFERLVKEHVQALADDTGKSTNSGSEVVGFRRR